MPPSLRAPLHTASKTLLDTHLRVETPEGIDLLLRPAGPTVRALAFAIDLAIRGALLGVLYVLLSLLGDFGLGLGVILLFLINWWYMVLFEVLNQGRSPGKHWLGLRVIHDDGTPIGWAASLTRNLLRAVDMLPVGYAFGLFSCLQHPAFKRIGDIAAGTLVVYREQPLKTVTLPDVPPINPPSALSLDEQRALLSFAERAAELSPARRLELATLMAEPLQVPVAQAEQQLYGIARGLLGPT
ncbi:RDD family protein [Pseudomonas sp. 5P_3.1_Bac2]|uniref:RDD family protein n=1 Tax=Pseudomonas sp. 5P_3.1_Bac2 TaxID=2971617 RepID=UPI0021C96D6C|nr:RDD family protein [Pseudomonas sp. 5P_3.1_Bac2]MCU1715710.1 RDD family protein [Pseudomonas sp. 5P_3.1_Bac2]